MKNTKCERLTQNQQDILAILRRNDAEFASKLLMRAMNLERVLYEKNHLADHYSITPAGLEYLAGMEAAQ